jgi:integrase/recombinase XerD
MILCMLSIYRRHLPDCAHKAEGRKHNKCSCPIWVDGMLDGSRINYSLKTRNWRKANISMREVEIGASEPPNQLKTVEEACQDFIGKLSSERMTAATVRLYQATLLGTFNKTRERQAERYTTPLASAAGAAGHKYVQQLDLAFFEAYRRDWPGGPTTAVKRIDRLRSFCAWCVEHGWMKKNYAKSLRPPANRAVAPTLPYTRDEFSALLKACDRATPWDNEERAANRRRLKTLILLLRFSGLRISDALQLNMQKIIGGRINLYMQKTKVQVCVPIPTWLIEELDKTPRKTGGYWWWNGSTSIDCTADIWRRRLKKAGELSCVADPEWHRFRDTFAVELILAGTPLDRVSVLLGHRSIKITERHYNPWVESRQAQLEADVAKAWAKDPLALMFELRQVSDSGSGATPN